MPHRISHEQLVGHDAAGERHNVSVTRAPIPGSPHLHGPPHYTWDEGKPLHLVDPKAGILECELTKRRLTIDGWRG